MSKSFKNMEQNPGNGFGQSVLILLDTSQKVP
jgi:hypothetical protein